MKEYTGKNLEEAIALAAEAEGLGTDEKSLKRLHYVILEEKKGLFGKTKSATVGIPGIEDAALAAEEYLKNACGAMGIEIETEAVIDEDIIKITLNSERNPVLIGKHGKTLQALNELAKLAVSNKLKKRYRILLDVGGYKEERYSRLEYLARKTAHQVQRSHISVQLDPMTPDERRVVHNALNGMRNIKTESAGEGEERAVSIIYVPGKKDEEIASAEPETEMTEDIAVEE